MAMWSVYTNRTTATHPFTFIDLQNLQNQMIASDTRALLFAEVEPVITLGQKQVAWNQSLVTRAELTVPVVPGERGGNETWHGPGQWVCFVVAPLEEWVGDKTAVKKAVCKTLTKILPVIQEFVPEAKVEEGDRLGIWSPLGKIASIGIKIQNGWMKSGFSVNVFPTSESFRSINPCGLDARPDFLLSKNFQKSDWNKVFEELPLKFKANLID